MENRAEKLKAAISSLKARIKAAYEYLDEEEQRAEEEGFDVSSLPDYIRIKGQIPLAREKLSALKDELDELGELESTESEDDFAVFKTEPQAENEETQAEAPRYEKEKESEKQDEKTDEEELRFEQAEQEEQDEDEEKPFITTTPAESPSAGHTAILGISAESLTKRGFAFLHDEEFEKAHDKFDNALDINPEYARAYIGLLCVELKVTSEAELANHDSLLTDKPNFKKALRYASEEYNAMLESFNQMIIGRIKQKKIEEKLRIEKEEVFRQDEESRLAQEERRIKEKKRKLEEEMLQKEEERKKEEEEAKRLKAEEERRAKEKEREERLRQKQLEKEQEKKLIAEEQEFRKNQKEWVKKGLCFYCGGKKNLVKKCKDCGKTS